MDYLFHRKRYDVFILSDIIFDKFIFSCQHLCQCDKAFWGEIIYLITYQVREVPKDIILFSKVNVTKRQILICFMFFKFYFIFKLYIIILVLPNIKMNPLQVYMCSPPWTLLPPPSPYHLSGSSQCTSPKHPVSCIEAGLATHFIHDILHVSMPFSQIVPPSPSRTESIRLFYTSVSLLLSRTQGYCYHLSKFHIYALVYCIGVFLSGLFHSV